MHIFHKWSKWQLIGEGKLTEGGQPYAMYYRQKRTCEICGKTKIKDTEA